MRILRIIKTKQTGKTVGYDAEHGGETRIIDKSKIISFIEKYGCVNAELVNQCYLRGKGQKLPVRYVHSVEKNQMFVDYSNYNTLPQLELGGVGKKIVVDDGYGNRYILKFPKKKAGIIINDHITEYAGSNIAKLLGFDSQKAWLGYYKGEECVVLSMFDFLPVTFDGLGESTLEGSNFEYNTDRLLDLKTVKFTIHEEQYLKWVWDVFVLDLFLSNFDRHENNWGFDKTGKNAYGPAPLYDFGASLYPKYINEDTSHLTDREIKNIIEFKTRSAIVYKGKKKNYFDILKSEKGNDLLLQSVKDLLTSWEKIDIVPILSHVSTFNKDYETHSLFLERVFDIKVKMLRSIPVMKKFEV